VEASIKTRMVLGTEIRCEEAKGGMAFELRLADPVVQTPPSKRASSPPKELSAEQIAEKLRAAEERRKVIYLG